MAIEVLVIAVVFLVGLLTALACHSRMSNYLLASVCSAMVATLVIQVIAFVENGYIDPFFLIAMANSFFGYLLLSLVIGLPFVYRRRKKRESG